MSGRGRWAFLAGIVAALATVGVWGSGAAEAGPPTVGTAATAIPHPQVIGIFVSTAPTLSGTINGVPIQRLASATSGSPNGTSAGKALPTYILSRPYSSSDPSWAQWYAANGAPYTVVLTVTKPYANDAGAGTSTTTTTFVHCVPTGHAVVTPDGGPGTETLTFGYEAIRVTNSTAN